MISPHQMIPGLTCDGEIDIETIAEGSGIRILSYLENKYGGRNWKKKKGIAKVQDPYTGLSRLAEIHWFEAHGVGKVEVKRKRWLE
ncbi:MAG: hypothetical protein HY731_09325 [Candidatus Tectomicrobia bacterium]|nr:hypothetical protein [Candidatus Tectomicrobia bacterium]